MRFTSRIAGFIRSSLGKRPRLGLGLAIAAAVFVPLLLWGQSTQWSFPGNNTASVTGVSIGIGTASPSTTLDVENGGALINYGGTISAGDLPARTLMLGPRPDGYPDAALGFQLNSSVKSSFEYDANGFHFWSWNNAWVNSMNISPTGTVGVGTTPGPVYSGVYANPTMIMSQSDTATVSTNSAGPLVLVNPHNAVGNLTSILFAAKNQGGNIEGNAQIAAQFTSVAGTGDSYPASDLHFSTNIAAGPAERMRITSAGNVGINTTAPQYPLSVNGTIQAKNVIVIPAGPTTSSTPNTVSNR